MIKDYFSHPLLIDHKLDYRQYQQDIVTKLLYQNSLVVIPTSLGKTVIALLTCLDVLFNWKNSKILILAPTRPLVIQHFQMFENNTVLSGRCIALTGNVAPEIRKTIWRSRSIRIYFATPELVNNDLRNNILKKDEFYLVVFDEAQRAVKDYSYTHISRQFYEVANNVLPPLILGLSASPGSNEMKIKEVCSNLFIEQIIAKTDGDADVLPYIYNTSIEYCLIKMNNSDIEISNLLNSMIRDYLSWLVKNNFLKKKRIENIYKKDILELRDYINSRLDPNNPNFLLMAALKYQSLSMVLFYCRDLIESQGHFVLKKFLDSSKSNTSKTYIEFFSDNRIKETIKILDANTKTSSPKLEKMLSIVKEFTQYEDMERSDSTDKSEYTIAHKYANNELLKKRPENPTFKPMEKKVLIFSQYRDTLEEIIAFLEFNDVSCKGFFGQSNKNGKSGLNQEKQLSILEDFRKGKFQVLVATSVAEEGLNIPNVDLVLFYEPVPSEIRFIQRKGRTGRYADGRVVILIYENSIDIKYLESAKRKVLNMKSSLQNANFSLTKFNKRHFDQYDRMSESEVSQLRCRIVKPLEHSSRELGEDANNVTNPKSNPIIESITSNSNRNIKHLVKRLSYSHTRSRASKETDHEFTRENLEDLYEISLNLDRKKIVNRVQRRIQELLGQSGNSGLNISQLEELNIKDKSILTDAISNLKKLKRISVSKDNVITPIGSKKQWPGNKYTVCVEKILTGKALVRVNEKWYAVLEHSDYFGPRGLLKKGNIISVIGELYRNSGRLHLIVKKII